MGIIRKTLSISTLGLVSWRSKKEQLREATEQLELTRADLEQAAEKHSRLRSKLDEAERRVQEAELGALRDARVARRAGRSEARRRLGRGRVAFGAVRDVVEPLVDQTRDAGRRIAADVQPALDSASKRARKQQRKARAKADKRAKKLRKRGGQMADDMRERAEELVHS